MSQPEELAPAQPPAISDFQVEVRPDRELVVVEVHGELCLDTVPRLVERAGERVGSGFAQVVFDLREVTFLDSTGVRLLIETEHRAQNEGFRFAIVLDGGQPARVLELVGMTDRPARLRPEDLPVR
jgi:anti-sigma B factor antagonist